MLLSEMPGRSHRGPLPPLRKDEVWLEARLARHVEALSVEVGERHVWRPGSLGAAAALLEESLRGLGTVVREAWVAEGEEVANVWVELPGAALPEERVIVGAHYDTVRGSPGANDNATGLAALLELGRVLAGQRLARTVRLVVFANGEQPFFGTRDMGSRRHAAGCRARSERVVAMLSLDSLGFYSTEPDSQRFPGVLRDLYPDTGDFVAFVSDLDSRELLRRCVASFRRHAGFPSEGIAGPRSQKGIGWSDHRSFWAEGFPALVVTDTSPFRYPHLHRPTDVAGVLDLGRCARVVSGLSRCVAELAGPLAP
jgi:hypothetical protein